MKIAELRQLTPKKLWALVKKSRHDLAVSRFHAKTGQNQDTAKIGKLRKVIARGLTILNNEKK